MLKGKSIIYPTASNLAVSSKISFYKNNAIAKLFAELFRSNF